MIDKIVRNAKNNIIEPKFKIVEKLDYFRVLSNNGLQNITSSEFKKLKNDIKTFFNLSIALSNDISTINLFRIRKNEKNDKSQIVKFKKITDLIGPKKEDTTIQRANMKGESVFYAALDMSTAISETRPETGDTITLSEWRLRKDKTLRNTFIFHPDKININSDSQKAFIGYLKSIKNLNKDLEEIYKELLSFIAEEFMKPVEEDINYLFSSLFSSNILQKGKDANDYQIESITYPSVKGNGKVTNIAILNSLILEKLELISVKTMKIIETNYEGKPKKSLINSLMTETKKFNFDENKIYWD